jgi:hypothetical protein
MTPATYVIPNHYKNDTFNEITFTIKEDAVAVDLTGATIKIDFRKNKNTGILQVSFTIGSGITVDNAVGGVFTLNSFINNWVADVYYYDAEITFASGVVRTYFKGTLTVNQDIESV